MIHRYGLPYQLPDPQDQMQESPSQRRSRRQIRAQAPPISAPKTKRKSRQAREGPKTDKGPRATYLDPQDSPATSARVSPPQHRHMNSQVELGAAPTSKRSVRAHGSS